MIKISASTHPAKEQFLPYVLNLDEIGIDMIHCDVMDGKFVKNIAFSYDNVKQINNKSTTILDVHLMLKNPLREIKKYKRAGADIITVHYEAFSKLNKLIKTLKKIKKLGVMVGLSIQPNTKIDVLFPLLPYLDLVLIMSVEAGESGQEFIKESLQKIKALKEIIKNGGFNILIEVDGGVNLQNKTSIIESGADILVIGSALYNATDKKGFIKKIKE